MLRFLSTCVAAVVLASAGGSAPALAQQPAPFVQHRAVYDLSLVRSQGKAAVVAVRGRILYDFKGSACDGYTLDFRQVSELDNGEGGVILSDLRANTWEAGDAASFNFRSENRLNENLTDEVSGEALRGPEGIKVRLTKPAKADNTLEATVLFPTQHVARVLDAAREGRTVFETPVYDGSDKGEKVYNTLTVIGREIAAAEKPPEDAAAGKAELAGLRRWPVTVSYFDRTADRTGEQLPVYAISFELYENGISRALTLDYNDFVIRGALTSLDIAPAKPCKDGGAK